MPLRSRGGGRSALDCTLLFSLMFSDIVIDNEDGMEGNEQEKWGEREEGRKEGSEGVRPAESIAAYLCLSSPSTE